MRRGPRNLLFGKPEPFCFEQIQRRITAATVTDRFNITVIAPNVTLAVADQTGDGATLTVDNAPAPNNFYVAVHADDATLNGTDTVAANESFTGNLTLSPALTENATVTVAVHDAATDTKLAVQEVDYTVVVPLTPLLAVADQTGPGDIVSGHGRPQLTILNRRL